AAAPAEQPLRAVPREEAEEAAPAEEGGAVAIAGLEGAYALLQEALRRLTSRDGKAIRDGDVKRKMLDVWPGFDESELGFSKFTRFLRHAHEAEVIDLNRTAAGNYEVSLPSSGKKLPPPLLPERKEGAAPKPQATEP